MVPVLLLEEYQSDCSVVVSWKRDLLWAVGEMLQLLYYLRSMLGPQVIRIPVVFLLKNMYPLLDEGFMCKAWCFRGWVELVVRALFHPAPGQPTCSTGWTAVYWNVLKFVKFIAQKSRSHDESKDYSKYRVFFCLTFHMELTLLPHLAWLQYLLQCHYFSLFFFYCYNVQI